MHKVIRSVRQARAWAKVRQAVWARNRVQAVAAWDGSDFDWVASHVEDVWKARQAARAAR